MILKQANKPDISLLLPWIEEFYKEDNHRFEKEKIISALELLFENSSPGKIFILEKEEEEIGYLIVSYGWSLEYFGKDSIIDELYIIKSERGKGYGEEALKLLEEELVKQGINTIHLEVNDNNKAVNLYKRIGYVPHNSVFMSKRLNKKEK